MPHDEPFKIPTTPEEVARYEAVEARRDQCEHACRNFTKPPDEAIRLAREALTHAKRDFALVNDTLVKATGTHPFTITTAEINAALAAYDKEAGNGK